MVDKYKRRNGCGWRHQFNIGESRSTGGACTKFIRKYFFLFVSFGSKLLINSSISCNVMLNLVLHFCIILFMENTQIFSATLFEMSLHFLSVVNFVIPTFGSFWTKFTTKSKGQWTFYWHFTVLPFQISICTRWGRPCFVMKFATHRDAAISRKLLLREVLDFGPVARTNWDLWEDRLI